MLDSIYNRTLKPLKNRILLFATFNGHYVTLQGMSTPTGLLILMHGVISLLNPDVMW